MTYVYLLRSELNDNQTYIGYTTDLTSRLSDHNHGKSKHTSKYRPWQLVTYLAFDDKEKALLFEKYLKSGSGRAFTNKHLW